MMAKTKLDMFRGDTKKWDLTVTQDGVEVDISTWSFWMTAKFDAADADAAAVFQKTSADGISITDAAHGLARIKLSPDDTTDLTEGVSLYYDVQGKDGTGEVFTLAYGSLKVFMDATISTT